MAAPQRQAPQAAAERIRVSVRLRPVTAEEAAVAPPPWPVQLAGGEVRIHSTSVPPRPPSARGGSGAPAGGKGSALAGLKKLWAGEGERRPGSPAPGSRLGSPAPPPLPLSAVLSTQQQAHQLGTDYQAYAFGASVRKHFALQGSCLL